jgi:hypothetical protein
MTSFRPCLLSALIAAAFAAAAPAANATISLIAQGSLSGQALDKSNLDYTLENGKQANSAGGLGSGLAWAGGNTFIAVQDRGPNVDAWNASLDNTTSFIGRFQSLTLALSASAPAAPLPYSLTPTLTATTLMSSATPLNYGVGGAPALNSAGKNYFTGRSDNFGAGGSLNPNNARLDPEAVRVSRDGKSVFVSDEYGPYVYQFDRFTGERLRSYALPATFGIANLSSTGATEISGNTTGRVTNKGMEGLAISPDGKFLFGFTQSPLLQDGGDGGQANRIVKIDVESGAISQYAYNNKDRQQELQRQRDRGLERPRVPGARARRQGPRRRLGGGGEAGLEGRPRRRGRRVGPDRPGRAARQGAEQDAVPRHQGGAQRQGHLRRDDPGQAREPRLR